MSELHIHGRREQLRTLLRALVRGMAGGSAGEYEPYVRGIKQRIGLVALACIQEAYIEKASGGSGEDGIQWEPLKKETIAARPIGRRDVAGLKAKGITKKPRGFGARTPGPSDIDSSGRTKRAFLTAAQDKRWRTIYATRKWQLMARHGMSAEGASERAAQIAWATLKAEGAKTKLEVLGNRSVQIGRDSGRLFNSLSAGVDDPEHYPLLQDAPAVEDRILREEPGVIIVGSDCPYAAAFHAQRPLWPDQLPEAWSQRIAEAARSGIEEAIDMILASQPVQPAA